MLAKEKAVVAKRGGKSTAMETANSVLNILVTALMTFQEQPLRRYIVQALPQSCRLVAVHMNLAGMFAHG
jgi:hypothetical protein